MDGIEFWHWWVLAILLAGIEVFAPGAVFIWLGIGAAAVGALLLVIPALSWEFQLLAFAVFAVAALGGSRLLIRRIPIKTDDPGLNRRAEHSIGRVLVLETAIVDGRGRAFVGDTLWTVEGRDLPAGEKVRVIGANGTILRVEPL